MQTPSRQEKAQAIAQTKDAVRRLDEHTYSVQSQSGNGAYAVVSTEGGWRCACADHKYRNAKCKHIQAVEISLQLRQEVRANVTVIPERVLACRYCNSDNIVQNAKRYNKYGAIQRYLCKGCGKRFSFNIGFERMHATPQIITTAMQLYFSGESFRNVQRFIKLQGLDITHQTVYNWIKKYVALMGGYLDKITPQVSDTWRTDEIYMKMKGNPKYIYAMIDDETRYWIAQQISDKKYNEDVRPMFKEAKETAGKRPLTLISDGAHNFAYACKKEYYTQKNPKTKHISHIHLKGDLNNNKMERFNGEIRDREKVMRGLKKMDTPILLGYQLYHNYFREHEALEGKTPAEVAGIKIQGGNKWITVIQNATSAQTGTSIN
jgi:transposase-like protein